MILCHFHFPAESSFHVSPVSEEVLCSVDQLFSGSVKGYKVAITSLAVNVHF